MTTSDVITPTATASTSLHGLGLFVLRFAVGATMLQAGLMKALDLDAVTTSMASSGWRMPAFAALMVTVAETAGGALLLLGLLTPLAAGAVLAAMIDAWAVNVAGTAVWSEPFNVPFLVAFSATALLFTGAGTFSLDAKMFGRARWPGVITVGMFVVAVAAAVATWALLNGSNPIHLTNPAA